MKNIKEIDTKFNLEEKIDNIELSYYNVPSKYFDLYGIFHDDEYGYLRVPMDVATSVSDGIANLTLETSGGRVKFSTDSKVFELQVEYDGLWPMAHMNVVAQGGFVLYEERENDRKYIKILPPNFSDSKGYTTRIALEGGKMRNYILYFPLYNPVKNIKIGLDKNAKIANGKKYKDMKPILYYGSSITQGGCASRPDNDYQGWIEKWNHIDFINLGFSGNGKGEINMANYLASLDCSLFVCDFNHSGIPIEELNTAHFRLYRIYRQKHPDTPILFLTKTNLWENNDNAQRERIIKKTYLRAKELGDKNVYFLSGHDMWDKKDKMGFTVDGDHPTDVGFYFMAKKIYRKMKSISKDFE